MSIVVTGATGSLGALAVEALLQRGVEPDQIVGAGRDQNRLDELARQGVSTVAIDYEDPDSLRPAFKGADQVLLVSGSEVGRRITQHRNAIAAAWESGVGLIVYTSIAHADTATSLLAKEHRATEEALVASGIPVVVLRNSWYQENYTAQIPNYLQQGSIVGSAGDGRISGATRRDYAEAAAAVVAGEGHAGRVYELGSDDAFTMAELAAELSRQSGREISYQDVGVDTYTEILVSVGLPEPLARTFADGDRAVAAGELHVDSGDLSRLIGRSPTPLSEAIATALA